MEDLGFTERTRRIEAAAMEALQGLEELRLMMAKESELSPTTVFSSSEETEEKTASNIMGQQGEQSVGEVQSLQEKQTKLGLWKRAMKHVKHDEKKRIQQEKLETPLQKDTYTRTDSKPTSKKTGWKVRSPLARRSPPKENPAQAAEIEKLRRALKDHKSARPPEQPDPEEVERMKIEIERLEEYKAAATRLTQEQLASQPKLRALEEENKNLKEEKHRLEPLTQVGVAIRCRFFETYKRETDLKSKEDATIIRNGNDAAHYGNVAADAALFFLKALDRAGYGKMFDAIYKIGTPDNYHGRYLSARATDIINFRGTVEASVYHPDKSLYERFMDLEKKCRALLFDRNGPLSTVISMIDSDQVIQKHSLQMREMAAQICNQARIGKRRGEFPRSAKQLERRRRQEEQMLATTESKPGMDMEKATTVEVTTEITGEKPKKKKKKRKKKAMGVFVLEKLAALEGKAREVQVVVAEEEEKVEPSPAPHTRVDIGQLGRVELVIPGFFGAISSIFGYGG